MVESQPAGYVPSPEVRALITKHLGDVVTLDSGYNKNVTLKQTEAKKRDELVSEIEYDFQLALNKGNHYIGKAVVNFYLMQMPAEGELFIDFQAVAIADLLINDKRVVGGSVYADQRIKLEKANIALGWNTVQLSYFNIYNTNRVGLHSYVDASDQEQYLYSQFEAFHCFHVFPVFDQPSLKAKMTLTVTCPQGWKTVSNSLEKRYENAKKEGKRVLERHEIEHFLKFYENENEIALYEFEQTPRISCYLYAICAGNYQVFTDYDPMHTPQRIFVRQSLVDNLRPELMFGVTKTTIELYQKSFGQRYPFSKVDHVMCPDYKYGAMENVGCITYSDSRICASKNMSTVDLTWTVVVIQHELCHMWFGNLVTMQWWDDLWLNEAFATALSYKACSLGGPHVDDFINESWLHMSAYKRWGLAEDLMPSNHKIQADCPSTDTAESLIDGITYGKGSSLIKQLIFLIGWETFTNGLKIYFDKHKWSNTTLPDFIGAIQLAIDQSNPDEASRHNLTKWAADWIQTKGSNKITAEFKQVDGKITEYNLRQTPCKYGDNIFRSQSFNIGFYGQNGQLVDKLENVTIKDELTPVPAMIGKQVPDAFLINADDWGFGHFELDTNSCKYFEQNLGKVQSQLDRAVIIGQIMAMMRQVTYPATRLPKVMNQLLNESNQNLINALVSTFLVAQATYLPSEAVTQFNKEATDFFIRKAKKEQSSSSLQIFCIEKAIQFLHVQEHLHVMGEWIITGNFVYNGENIEAKLTPEQKHAILKKYFACPGFTVDQKNALKEAALKEDQSDNAKLTAKICDWSLPDAELKKELWSQIVDPNTKDSLKDLSMKVQSFFQRKQQLDLLTPYFETYYEVLPKIVETRDREFAELFMEGLSPAFMARESDEVQLQQILEKANPEREFFILFLKKEIETIDIIKRSRALCASFVDE